MSKFAHIAKNVPTRRFLDRVSWQPPTWQGTTPPPKLVVVRPTDTNKMFARAILNPRIKGPKSRKDGKVREGDLTLGKERRILGYILGCVVDWDNIPLADDKGNLVIDEKTREVVMMPFVPIKDSEPTDPGAQNVRELLRALGEEAEADFSQFCGDPDNWLEPEAEDTEEDTEAAVPLAKP